MKLLESFGYSSWEEYVSAQTDSKLLDSGLEPETVKPLLKDLLKNDPEYKEAMKFKQEKEELEQKIWAKSELDTLNTKFGTSYSDVSELGENVVKLWNSGLTLDKAFAAENFEIIKENAIKKAKIADSGKGHLKPVTGGVINSSDIRKPSADELRYFKAFMPNLTEEQIVEKLNKKIRSYILARFTFKKI